MATLVSAQMASRVTTANTGQTCARPTAATQTVEDSALGTSGNSRPTARVENITVGRT